jgi:predicted MPP superfamily phosphohydrolase
LLLPLAICAYASFVGPYQLRLERANVPVAGLTGAGEPIRIAVLADIQTDRITKHEHDAVDRALSTQPDVIVLAGDFFQGNSQEFRTQLPAFRQLLARLEAPGGVYACEGNIDHPSRLRELFEGTPIRWLHNETAIVNVRGRTLAIAGVEWNYRSAAAQQVCRNLRHTDADARILLCHTPDGALETEPDDRIDLVISGHTHGGQVVIPGFGPPLTLSRVPRAVAAGGLHRLGHQMVYVSRGVGFERGATPPMRLFCPPEVSILSLGPGR